MSRLAQGLRDSQNENDYKVADFEAYYPALGDPKAFVAHAGLRRSAEVGNHAAQAADRANQPRAVG